MRDGLAYIGWPVIALSIGVWLSFRNIRTPEHRKASTNAWVEEALRISAMILVVTGLGGSLSEILRGTPAVDYISGIFARVRAARDSPAVRDRHHRQHDHGLDDRRRHHGRVARRADARQSQSFARGCHARGRKRLGHHQVRQQQLLLGSARRCPKLSANDAILGYGGATLVGGIVSFLVVCLLWVVGLALNPIRADAKPQASSVSRRAS